MHSSPLASPLRSAARLLPFYLILLPGSLALGSNTPLPLAESIPELSKILEIARKNAPDLLEQDLLKQESDQRLKQAKSSYYPKLNLVSNFGYRKDFRADGEDTDNLGLTFSANLTRPIYHWGAIEAQIEQARINNDDQTLNYFKEVHSIERRIQADYLNLILNNLALKNERRQQSILEVRQASAQINYEAGKLSQLSFSDSQLGLQASLLRISQIKQSNQRIAERFKLYAGTKKEVASGMASIPTPDLINTEKWVREQLDAMGNNRAWLSRNYDSQLKQNEIRHQEEAITIIKAKQRPLIDASLRASQNQSNTSSQNNVDTFSVFGGVRVSWNIFDGFQTRHEKIEATTRLRRLEMQLAKLSDDLKLQALEMLDALLFEVQNLSIRQALFENQQADLKNTEGEAQTGRITKQALENAQYQLGLNELVLHQQRANLYLSLIDYQNLVTPIRN